MLAAANDAAPGWVSIASLALSALALLVSTGTGLYTWRRSGEMVSVSGDIRLPLFQGAHRRPVRSGEIWGPLTITATNRGRTPVQVHRLWLTSKDTKKRSSFQREERSAPLPATIEARNRVHWYVSALTLGVLTKQYGNPLRV